MCGREEKLSKLAVMEFPDFVGPLGHDGVEEEILSHLSIFEACFLLPLVRKEQRKPSKTWERGFGGAGYAPPSTGDTQTSS